VLSLSELALLADRPVLVHRFLAAKRAKLNNLNLLPALACLVFLAVVRRVNPQSP
jgi:hypothetical protein